MPSPLIVPEKRMRAIGALVVACFFWGLGFPLVKAFTMAASTLDPSVSTWFVAAFMVVVRFAVAAVAVAIWIRTLPARRELEQGLAIGAVTGAGMLLQADALAYTEASTSAFLTQGYVVLLPIIGILRTFRLPPARVAVCAFMVFVGLAILSRVDPHTLALGRGEAETLGAAACFTIQILVIDAPGFAGNRNGPVSLVMFAAIALLVLPVALFTARGMDDVAVVLGARGSIANLAVATLLPTLGSFLLMNRFQPDVTPTEAGVVYATEPVFASAFAMFTPEWLSWLSKLAYANERADSRLVLGGALVVGANLLLSLGARSEPKAV
jgi:drug/metabolite transporter (DMT)-like permease